MWNKVLSGRVQVNSHTLSCCCSHLCCATGCVPGVSGVEQVKSVSVQTLTLFPGFQVLLLLSLALLAKHEILWLYFVVTFAVYNVSYIRYYLTIPLR